MLFVELPDLLAASIVVGALVDVDAGGVVVGVAQEPGQAGTLAAPHRVQTLLKIRDLIKIQGRFVEVLKSLLKNNTDDHIVYYEIGLNHSVRYLPPPSLHFFTPTLLFQWAR